MLITSNNVHTGHHVAGTCLYHFPQGYAAMVVSSSQFSHSRGLHRFILCVCFITSFFSILNTLNNVNRHHCKLTSPKEFNFLLSHYSNTTFSFAETSKRHFMELQSDTVCVFKKLAEINQN